MLTTNKDWRQTLSPTPGYGRGKKGSAHMCPLVVGWAVYALGYLHGEKSEIPFDEKASQLQPSF
jgi:hypothetical protein